MKIKGQVFYDVETHEPYEIDPKKVVWIERHDAHIDYGAIGKTLVVYLIGVMLSDDKYVLTLPMESEGLAILVAQELADICEASGNSQWEF